MVFRQWSNGNPRLSLKQLIYNHLTVNGQTDGMTDLLCQIISGGVHCHILIGKGRNGFCHHSRCVVGCLPVCQRKLGIAGKNINLPAHQTRQKVGGLDFLKYQTVKIRSAQIVVFVGLKFNGHSRLCRVKNTGAGTNWLLPESVID